MFCIVVTLDVETCDVESLVASAVAVALVTEASSWSPELALDVDIISL